MFNRWLYISSKLLTFIYSIYNTISLKEFFMGKVRKLNLTVGMYCLTITAFGAQINSNNSYSSRMMQPYGYTSKNMKASKIKNDTYLSNHFQSAQ